MLNQIDLQLNRLEGSMNIQSESSTKTEKSQYTVNMKQTGIEIEKNKNSSEDVSSTKLSSPISRQNYHEHNVIKEMNSHVIIDLTNKDDHEQSKFAPQKYSNQKISSVAKVHGPPLQYQPVMYPIIQ